MQKKVLKFFNIYGIVKLEDEMRVFRILTLPVWLPAKLVWCIVRGLLECFLKAIPKENDK
jgi:hypothetical protein